MDRNQLFRRIPKVDVLLADDAICALIGEYGYDIVMDSIRVETDLLRETIRTAESEEQAEAAVSGLTEAVGRRVRKWFTPNVRKVINATGTILHTNLGRAPISRAHAERLAALVSGYSNLEYDLEAGHRGERYAPFEKLLCRLTGAEAAMAVNNNASAVLLILSTLAKGGEAIVSRGELIEIGGKFRIPDVMEQSGAKLVEVGTTNKTHLSDYEEAVTEETKAILKVHTSNYKIVGFTENVTAAELRPLADAHGIPVVEDLGSGVLVNLEKWGITHEPTVQEAIQQGIDVVCFSGDKLLGGPQAGIIIGKKEYISRMKKNPLTRAVRIDKFTVTALEQVLLEYLNEEQAVKNIPVLRMLSEPYESVKERAEKLAEMIRKCTAAADVSVADSEAQLGGGSLPAERIPSVSVVIRPHKMSTAALECAMREGRPPIVGRTAEDAVWLDVRTMTEEEFEDTAKLFGEVLG